MVEKQHYKIYSSIILLEIILEINHLLLLKKYNLFYFRDKIILKKKAVTENLLVNYNCKFHYYYFLLFKTIMITNIIFLFQVENEL